MTKLTQPEVRLPAGTSLHNPHQEAQPWPLLWPVVEAFQTSPRPQEVGPNGAMQHALALPLTACPHVRGSSIGEGGPKPRHSP
jgi:hypothetical protein